MKITFVLPGFSRFPVGGFQIVYQYANYLANQGHDVEIVHAMFVETQNQPKFLTNVKYQVKQTLLQLGLIKSWFKLDKRIKVVYKGITRTTDIRLADKVIATAWETAEFVNELPEKCGEKYYFIQHYEIWGGKERVDRTWKLPLKKIVIAIWLKNIAIQFNETAVLVPNFVEHENFYVTKKIESRAAVIAMLYSEHAVKGSKDGFAALKIVKEKHPELQMKIFGVFDEPANLPKDAVYYKNPSRREMREDIYNDASIYVFPSVSEGWGLTATEAMACGVALCSTDNGGVDDFGIENETALISPVKNPEALASNIDKLLTDTDLRCRLAKNGKKLVDKLTLENSGALFEKALSE